MRSIITLFLLFPWMCFAQQGPLAAGMPVDGTTVVINSGNSLSAVVPPQKSYIYPTAGFASSGFSVTIPNGITIFVVNASSGLAAGTITLPPNPSDGMPLTLECPKGITLVSLLPNTGQSISNSFAITTFGINSPARLKYSAINSTWYPN